MLNRTDIAHPMLANFPAEVVELIAGHLPWVDFCNFRLAGRELCDKSSDAFVRRFFTTKRILFSEYALNGLLSMLEYPHLFRTLRTIRFCAGPTLMVPRDGETMQYEAMRYETKSQESQRMTEAEYLEYARDYEMLCFEDDGRFQSLAHGIMQCIGRLDKSINISFDVCVCSEREHAAMTARSQRQVQPYADYSAHLHFDETGSTKERHYRNNTMITSMMVQPLLKSAVSIDARIKAFCVGGWCGCHVLDLSSMKAWDDDLSNLTRFTAKLETLQFSVRGFRGNQPDHRIVIGNFVSMINASHGLKTLQLQFTWQARDDAGNQELTKGLLQSHLPQLEYIVLDNMCCSANYLRSMLLVHR